MQAAENIARAAVLGGSILASGQGGVREHGEKVASLALELGDLQMISLDALHEDDLLLDVSTVGSPSARARYLLPNYHIQVVQKMIAYSGLPIKGLIAASSGGMLTVNPWLPAVALSLPVVDAVSNARSHPDGGGPMTQHLPPDYTSLQMIVGGNPKMDSYVEAYLKGNLLTNAGIARQLAVRAGGVVCVARNPVTVGYAKRHAGIGHVSCSIELGRMVLEKKTAEERIRVVCGYTKGNIIVTGKVSRFNFNTKGSYDTGIALVESREERCTIHFQNQYMELHKNGQVIAAFPDLIIVLSLEDGMPVASYQLETEQEVAVIAVSHKDFQTLGEGVRSGREWLS